MGGREGERAGAGSTEVEHAAKQIKRLADAGQHAERQDVDLENAQRIQIVLVPLDHGAVRHRRIGDRHHLVEPALGQHEAADMLGEMAREAGQLALPAERQAQPRRIRVEAALAGELGIEAAVAPAPDARWTARSPCPPTAPAPCPHRGSRCASGSGSRWRRCRHARGRTSHRCIGSPPRAARARNRRRCRAARCARPR